MSIGGILASICCCTEGECDCATTSFEIAWTGELIFLNDCDTKQFPECDNPPTRYGSLSITSHTLALVQRASCSYSASYQWDATSTSCFDEEDISTVSIVMDAVLYKLPPGAGGEWRLNLQIRRYLDGAPYGIGFGGTAKIADWTYAPDCTPPDGSCPCTGDWLYVSTPASDLNAPSTGPEEQCDGALLWQSLDSGSIVLS
jgi:hypothetical protein